jgi:transcription initiation factor IIE alpha subunit
MMVQKTSIDSYKIVKETRQTVQQRIYDTIKSRGGTVTNRQISLLTKIPINSVTARVKELRETGTVVQAGTEYDSTTRRNVMTWRVV